ncbi:MAG: TAXI family TRAP transporter solute-binding subunit [Syntrophorhabdaceae bacterium]|nr:TAXI family TRAP transporter solute-binding subunit [Syntrophorhabdaceae bacterium]MDD5242528.1 TAXI family TRAP transporter solute-binding subunit [Syntrophorhabdaceae bacterium]
MLRKTKILLIIVCVMAAVTLSLYADAAEKITRLLIGSTSTTSSFYSYNVGAAKAINRLAPGINATVVATQASVDNIERIRKGQLDMGLTGDNAVYEAYNGLKRWQGKPNPEFRWIWGYIMQPVTIIVRKDSGIKSIYDLNGKLFHAGNTGSSTEQMVTGAFEVLGIKPQYYKGAWSDSGMAIMDNRIVGLAKNASSVDTPDALILEIQTKIPITVLAFSEDNMKKIKAKYPYYLDLHLQPNIYKGQTSEVYCIGQATGTITTKDVMSNEVAYKVIKAIVEGIEDQAAAFPAVKGKNLCEMTLQTAPIPLHAGSVKYLKEKGYKVPAKLIPPEYKD